MGKLFVWKNNIVEIFLLILKVGGGDVIMFSNLFEEIFSLSLLRHCYLYFAAHFINFMYEK